MDDDLKELEQKFIRAGEYGGHLQKEGIKIVRAAEKGLEAVAFIELKKDLNKASRDAWVAGANASIPVFPPNNSAQIRSYYLAIGTSAAASLPIFSDFYPKEEYGLNGSELQELDSYLTDFSQEFKGIGDLVKMRKGSWDTFHSATDVTSMTASHAMREILSKIISQLGSNAKIEKEKAVSLEDKDRKISKKDRLEFLLSDPGSKWKAAEDMVTMASNKCFEAFTRLQEMAHGSEGEMEEVKQNMRITENALLSILRFWKLRSKKD